MTVDRNVRTGVVSVTHGRVGQSPGQLTSSHEDVDLVTAMPQASGVAVDGPRRPDDQPGGCDG